MSRHQEAIGPCSLSRAREYRVTERSTTHETLLRHHDRCITQRSENLVSTTGALLLSLTRATYTTAHRESPLGRLQPSCYKPPLDGYGDAKSGTYDGTFARSEGACIIAHHTHVRIIAA